MDNSPDHSPAGPPLADDALICYCMLVEAATIRSAIATGATSIEALQDLTFASTGCGTCRWDLQRLLQEAGCEPGEA